MHGHMAQDEDVDDRKKEKEKVSQKEIKGEEGEPGQFQKQERRPFKGGIWAVLQLLRVWSLGEGPSSHGEPG